jgi:hypothetical protein
MRIDFNKELKHFDGEVMREGDSVFLQKENGQIQEVLLKGKVVALKTVCVNAVNGRFQDEPQLSVEEHTKRFKLAMDIFSSNGDGFELESEQIALIKKLLAKTNYPPLVVGQACEMLEGK